MIVGFSHLTMRCVDIESAMPLIGTWNYELDFRQDGVENPAGKRPLLSAPCDRMRIALFRRAGAVPVELVEYPDARGASEGAIALVQATPEQPEDGADNSAVATAVAGFFGLRGPVVLDRSTLDTPIWRGQAANDRTGIVGVVHRTPEFDASVAIWLRLGARAEATHGAAGSRMARVRVVSPVRALSLNVLVVEDEGFRPATHLDGRGATCLSFLTSSVDHDRKSIDPDQRLPTTRPFNLTINAKPLRLEIVEMQPGFYVELLERRVNPA
jgi:hypothetical protein